MPQEIIRILPGGDCTAAVRRAAEVIRSGGVLLYPTDTIYGLGCDAMNEGSVKRIFGLKGRMDTKSALVLVGSEDDVRKLVEDMPRDSHLLSRCFWPGPLTMIFRAKNRARPLVVSENGTIAIRIPKNDFCLQLAERAGVPVLSTSANISGTVVPSRFSDLERLFKDTVDLMIDAGDAQSDRPSTIVDVTGNIPEIVREGAIPAAQIRKCLEII